MMYDINIIDIILQMQLFIICSGGGNLLPKKQSKHVVKNMQTIKELRTAVKHAKLICRDYEYTRECKIAWQKVDILVNSLRKNESEYNNFPYDD